MKSFLNQSGLPRGIRNNNPGNIRFSAANNWKGKIPSSQNRDSGKAFEQFESFAWGIRAMIILVGTYVRRHGLTTIEKILARWAPNSENNTEAYINNVVQKSGIARNTPININDPDQMYKLLSAMTQQENGLAWKLSRTDFNQGWQLTGNSNTVIQEEAIETTQASSSLILPILIGGGILLSNVS